jgi:hypothetical protein
VPNVAEQLSQEVQAGIRHQSALAPFADSSIPGARELHLVVHDKIELLDRSKDWLYSQQALRRIAHVKQSLAMPPMEKLKYLVVIQEERLLPYIAKQFNEAWEIAFNDIKGDDDKMEALKLRVIRRNAP